ncbi:hypothetical protein [Methanopyrus sp. KOL6]|uniref:hypothetical protein n=1 Tax=Methanopyrus sp. KOL6 TaxID=1937004 RepID=UPI000B4AEB68|nr:hypothetical protein [Methanopyrus sp. KOL6]
MYGMAYGVVDTVERAVVAELSGTATSYGVYHALVGVGSLVCGLVVGWLWESVSPWATFGYSACVIGVAAALVPVLIWGRSSASEQ